MKVKILTPEKIIFEGEAEEINIPTTSGHISVLNSHTPLVSVISPGEIVLKTKEGKRIFTNQNGVVQTINSQTSLLLTVCKEKSL
ncbi:MAG: F0F1 ATP synthase subunit epsilon [Dysgonamonadaceae bacterium]|nr:F0F1 ATP synthase subunit epsilon [Dysgonamonadaceae bacterium]